MIGLCIVQRKKRTATALHDYLSLLTLTSSHTSIKSDCKIIISTYVLYIKASIKPGGPPSLRIMHERRGEIPAEGYGDFSWVPERYPQLIGQFVIVGDCRDTRPAPYNRFADDGDINPGMWSMADVLPLRNSLTSETVWLPQTETKWHKYNVFL